MNAVPQLQAAANALFDFALPANTFSDPDFDIGDTLDVSASLAGGAALPAWLAFDAVTARFSIDANPPL